MYLIILFCRFQIFPSLNVTNNPSIIDTTADGSIVAYESGSKVYYPDPSTNENSGSSSIYLAAITHNRTSLSYPGRPVHFTWEAPGKITGYDNKYTTNTTAGVPKASTSVHRRNWLTFAPQFAAWVSQLNITYTPLQDVDTNAYTASTIQPNGTVFGEGSAPIVNGTMFVVLTDTDLYVTPYNLSLINTHVVAGPVLYQAD